MWQDYTISASVGRNGVNNPQDVVVIQILLNRIPPEAGGPAEALDADGLYGPKTLAAIERFQTYHNLGSDKRIDPGGAMLAKINQIIAASVAQPETPPPNIPVVNTPASGADSAIIMGLWGRAGAGDEANPDNGIADGEPLMRECPGLQDPAPRHITHTTLDGDEHIWVQIIDMILNDVRPL